VVSQRVEVDWTHVADKKTRDGEGSHRGDGKGKNREQSMHRKQRVARE
jgi:hypothetical protein